MAFSYSEATGDGSTKVFPFSFSGSGIGYIRAEDIHVLVDGVETENFTFPGSNQIQLAVAPAAPVDGLPNIMIRRIVPKDVPYADFTRGNNFGQDQLNNTALQQLYALHEFLDGFLPDGYFVKSDMDMKGNRITNIGYPFAQDDAATLSYITSALPSLVSSYVSLAVSTMTPSAVPPPTHCDATLGDVTLALPSSGTGELVIVRDDASANRVLLVAADGTTVLKRLSYELYLQGESVRLVFADGDWGEV